MTLLRCIAPGCRPAWFRLDAPPPQGPAGSAAPSVHCPYCGNPAPYELYFAAAAGSTQVAHEVVLGELPKPGAAPRRTPLVRFSTPRPGDKSPPLLPPETDRRERSCPACGTAFVTYAPTASCPRCGPA